MFGLITAKVGAFAARTMAFLATAASDADVSGSVESIKGMLSDFSVSNLIIIIGGALALTVGLIIFWFAFRFIIRKVYGALKGKFGF